MMSQLGMLRYQLYLLDHNARIRAADWFVAGNDDEAASIGAVVFSCSDDVFCGYEVWRGERSIVESRTGLQLDIAEIRLEVFNLRQKNIVDLEESLADSWVCLKDSQKLLSELSRTRP